MNSVFPRPLTRRLRLPGVVLALLLAAGAALSTAEAAEGSKVKSPVALKRVMPIHPVMQQKKMVVGQALIGQATLECLVSETGAVQSVKTVSASHPEFGQAAEDALRQWEFQPGEVDGRPAAMRVQVPFEFNLTLEQIIEAGLQRTVFQEINDLIVPARELPAWPNPVKYLLPKYPDSLKGTGKYGKAVVSIVINKDGKVMNPTILKSTYPDFDLPALVTAAKLEFPPQVMANGLRICVSMDVQFDFKPEAEKPAAKAPKEKPKPEKSKAAEKPKT